MMYRTLKVLIAGQQAGTLLQGENGQLSFAYDPDYSGPPLSISMRSKSRLYKDKQVRPFLFGLLPDDPATRRSLGVEFGVSGNNPFDLLSHVGLDCPGAVQLCPEDSINQALERKGSLDAIDDHEIAHRLQIGRERIDAAWVDPSEHWSLGGQQSKFALRLENDTWHRCLGSSATTHIFKGGIGHLEKQALDEYVCMKLAKACGIPTAEVEYRTFLDEPALIIERFDRIRNSTGNVIRLHQEDFCQALGVLPENKYPEYGGPGTSDIIGVLKTTGSAARNNLVRFIQMLFFNYLIAAPDAHAKNYSLLLGAKGQAHLAPLYDVASLLPYARPKERMRTAMSVGGENRIGHIGRHAIERLVEANELEEWGIDNAFCIQIMRELAGAIPLRLAEVLEETEGIAGMQVLGSQLENGIAQLCETELRLLEG